MPRKRAARPSGGGRPRVIDRKHECPGALNLDRVHPVLAPQGHRSDRRSVPTPHFAYHDHSSAQAVEVPWPWPETTAHAHVEGGARPERSSLTTAGGHTSPATLAQPPPGAFQQVSAALMVGVSPNRVHLTMYHIRPDRPSQLSARAIGSWHYDLASLMRILETGQWVLTDRPDLLSGSPRPRALTSGAADGPPVVDRVVNWRGSVCPRPGGVRSIAQGGFRPQDSFASGAKAGSFSRLLRTASAPYSNICRS